jgi:hypothetical protein
MDQSPNISCKVLYLGENQSDLKSYMKSSCQQGLQDLVNIRKTFRESLLNCKFPDDSVFNSIDPVFAEFKEKHEPPTMPKSVFDKKEKTANESKEENDNME